MGYPPARGGTIGQQRIALVIPRRSAAKRRDLLSRALSVALRDQEESRSLASLGMTKLLGVWGDDAVH